ncbi:uncharacterized protein F5147DRAFT_760213 [Suillus discolor]|uniref:Uncharacterized protein n=1 Tax=Suillus discolor TaxID=1912936 RepID=A0A9P7FAH4_9AGAM|nr:uncharacterized protein F5147DRAFT_760213 [Suillus discolor]KAG2110537.1 hypothetical protein F5147DRAFT_760213 [Suillus discolor]
MVIQTVIPAQDQIPYFPTTIPAMPAGGSGLLLRLPLVQLYRRIQPFFYCSHHIQSLSTTIIDEAHAHTYHTAPPSVAEIPFAKTQEHNVAAGDLGLEKDSVPDEYFDQDPELQQQSTSIAGQTTT